MAILSVEADQVRLISWQETAVPATFVGILGGGCSPRGGGRSARVRRRCRPDRMLPQYKNTSSLRSAPCPHNTFGPPSPRSRHCDAHSNRLHPHYPWTHSRSDMLAWADTTTPSGCRGSKAAWYPGRGESSCSS